QTFRATVKRGSEDPNVLEHVRTCDACLDHALTIDPDFFFRSMGGGEMIPPGGIDSFVTDVMAQVRSRQTETSTASRLPLNRYLRVAAAVTFVIAGTTGIYRMSHKDAALAPIPTASIRAMPPTTTKAVVETYESKEATIVEIPATAANDAKVVMIYDE